MNRDANIEAIADRSTTWDCLVIGGGATGLGTALEAAARGYRVLLVEKYDFGKGTSSRSTKLVHGGVRYLEQGNVGLVREALHERGLLLKNAAHLAHPLEFVIPAYHYWQLPFYGVGLKVYDALAGKLSLGKSLVLGRDATVARLPNVETAGLKGGILYLDGQFDDARLAITILRTIGEQGGFAANYVEVDSLTKENGRVSGAILRDNETGRDYPVRAKMVINATGIFSDDIRMLDNPASPKIIAVAQGSHLVLPKKFLQSSAALMIPKTSDGRVLFAIPWHDRLVVGTTDFGVPKATTEPRIERHEIDFILKEAAKYLHADPAESDVLACFSGLRPLVKSAGTKSTAKISRDHTVLVAESGLVTVTGGKWTTYRHMGEDGLNHAEDAAGLPRRPSRTAELSLHGNDPSAPLSDPLSVYGTDRKTIEQMASKDESANRRLHPQLPYLTAEVQWAVDEEMARTVEDVLSRRTRALLLDANAAAEAAPRVAEMIAGRLSRGPDWVTDQVKSFQSLAATYHL